MVLLLFLIPLQPSPWQPGEGFRLWSQPGSLSAGADGGDQTGGSTLARDTLGQGHPWWGPTPRSPRWLWSCGSQGRWGPGVQGPAAAGSQHLLLQEMGHIWGFRGGDRPGGDVSRISKDAHGSSSLHHSHAHWEGISLFTLLIFPLHLV